MGVIVMKLTVPYNYSVQWLDQGVSFRLSEAHGEIPLFQKSVSCLGDPSTKSLSDFAFGTAQDDIINL